MVGRGRGKKLILNSRFFYISLPRILGSISIVMDFSI
jgi:hypothetical protein